MQLAEQSPLCWILSDDGEVLAGAELSLAQVTGEAGQVVHQLTGSSYPVIGGDGSTALGALHQLRVVLLAVHPTMANVARRELAQ